MLVVPIVWLQCADSGHSAHRAVRCEELFVRDRHYGVASGISKTWQWKVSGSSAWVNVKKYAIQSLFLLNCTAIEQWPGKLEPVVFRRVLVPFASAILLIKLSLEFGSVVGEF